jgi:hypothetical protein
MGAEGSRPLLESPREPDERETGDIHCDGQRFEQVFVGLRKDLIVSSNQLHPESGNLQRVTMVPFVQSSHVALIDLGAASSNDRTVAIEEQTTPSVCVTIS